MLTDPFDDLAAQNDFAHGLLGLSAVARMVRALAVSAASHRSPSDADDDFVHLLLGLAALGTTVEHMVASVERAPDRPSAPLSDLLR
jgi:hypothetical protein